MKRQYSKILLLFALSVCSVIANAQTLSVESIEANTGEQAELVVSASGMSGVTALQFNLAMPQSVTLNVSAITKGSDVSSHELKVEKKANGEYLFVLYHLDLGLVSNGTLLKLPITTGQQSGSLGGNLNTIRTASADAVSHNCADASFNITVKAPVVPVTITADDKTMTYGDDVPTLTYTSSGAALEGTPKLSTTATKTSPVGTYPIKVEKGTVTNEQVTYVDGTLTIGKAALTVGVQDVTITEGDAIPSFALTYSGFRNGDTEANAFTTKPTATTTATSSSAPGTYPITVSGGEATNYSLTYTQGTLTIQKKPVEPVTITADNKTMTYGDDVPTLTYTSSGAALEGTPKLSTTATKTSPVGTYPIKVEKGTVTNEQVTYVDGTLTIGKAALTVGVQDVTITEGDAIPSFTLTYSGFRNGDTEANAFTTKPTATTTATSNSAPGTYPITVSGGEATNYSLTYTQGTLTIQKKPVEPVTITADNKTMTYGDDVPTLTYTSSGAALEGTPKLSTTATKTSPVGTYPIKVEKGTVTNEQVTYVDGTLTIGKAALTVGVQDVTITEGDAIPSFALTYSGFRNGDTEANAFTTKPTATTTATSSSAPGTYPITISGGEATNYSLTYTQGTLTIQKYVDLLSPEYAAFNADENVGFAALGLSSDAIALAGGTVIGKTENITFKIGADDSYKAYPIGTITVGDTNIDGGIQGSTNPKDADGGVPATTLVAPAGGAFYLVEVAEDGFLYVFINSSSNKAYTVFEEGEAIGYSFSAYWGKERYPAGKGVYGYELKGGGKYNQLKAAGITSVLWPEQYIMGNAYDIANTPDSKGYGDGGLGVIKFPVYKDCKYIVNANGSKMTASGFYFDRTGDATITTNVDDAEVMILDKGQILGTTPITTEIWTIAGSHELMGSDWDPTDTSNDMSTTDSKIYTLVKEDVELEKGVTYEYKAAKDHAWRESYGANGGNATLTVEETAKYKVTFTFSSETKEVTAIAEKTGEATVDKKVYDVGDIVSLVDIIMNLKTAGEEEFSLYDMNKDNELNIGDIILVVREVLNGMNTRTVMASRAAADTDVDLSRFTAAQFTVSVPAGSAITDIRLTGRNQATHEVTWQQMDAGEYAVVIYSKSNLRLSPENGSIMEVVLSDGNGTDIVTGNVVLATPEGERVWLNSLPAYAATTGIAGLMSEASYDVYDLSGRKVRSKGESLRGLASGVYIINGKKTIIK